MMIWDGTEVLWELLWSRGLSGKGKNPPGTPTQQVGTYSPLLSGPLADTFL